uniref:Eukaryotic initiation factor n=1 Tax=Tetraselmis sp. GSL018 TaxID=582737 RepID=A0A061RZ06_9CHLO
MVFGCRPFSFAASETFWVAPPLFPLTRLPALSQGVAMSRFHDKTPEQEKLERRRQMPFHMHINLELIESVALISAMLIEVPNLAAGGQLDRRKVLSKSFQRLMDNHERQTFSGPPENVREHIVASTNALRSGDWAAAYKYVESLSCWNLMDGSAEVKEVLKEHIKEEALRTFLFTYSSHYSSLSLDQLCSLFDLPEKRVHGVVSKLMVDEELAGSWDQPTRTIVMHKVEASRLQTLAMAFADKASMIVDLNERALSFRTGGLRDNEDEEEGAGRGGRGQRRRGGMDEDGGGRSRGGRRMGTGMLRGLGLQPGGRRQDNRGFRRPRDRIFNRFEERDFADRGQGKFASSRNRRREDTLTPLGRPGDQQ